MGIYAMLGVAQGSTAFFDLPNVPEGCHQPRRVQPNVFFLENAVRSVQSAEFSSH
jgi:hypothetical protein